MTKSKGTCIMIDRQTTSLAPGGETPRSPSRRAALAAGAGGLAALAAPLALAGPAPAAGGLPAASATDPIFPVIDAHRAAWARYGATCGLIDEVAARNAGRVVTDGDEARYAAASRAEQDALDVFLSTMPTTRAGMRAAIDHALTFDAGAFDEFSTVFLRTLAASPVLAGGEGVQ